MSKGDRKLEKRIVGEISEKSERKEGMK